MADQEIICEQKKRIKSHRQRDTPTNRQQWGIKKQKSGNRRGMSIDILLVQRNERLVTADQVQIGRTLCLTLCPSLDLNMRG